jgi:hypothetical protein
MLANHLQIQRRRPMKRIKLLIGLVIVFMMLSAVSASTASAQALDGVWLKCKVNFKGHTLDTTTGDVTTTNGPASVYLHFVWNGIASYKIAVWTKPDGVWANTFNTLRGTILPGENFISEFALTFQLSSTDFLYTFHTPFINYKRNKSGDITKITYQGTGEVYYGEIEGKKYYGYFTISGTSVDPTKLPFDPNS